MAREITSKNIEGIADLVVVAPIREGFIDAFENVTFQTRLRIVAEALHNIRVAAREHEEVTPFSDSTERILTLLDFRIGILDRDMFELDKDKTLKARRYLYLAATFDGAWEPYMRLIWRPLGDLLDLLFCNTDGYVPAGDNSFADYAKWVRSAQVDSANFYATTGLTVRDQMYLRKLERLQRETPPDQADLAIARMTMPDVEEAAAIDRGERVGSPAERTKMARKAHALALEALTVLYRLADYYPPDRIVPTPAEGAMIAAGGIAAEGRYLLRAARNLLRGWDSTQIQGPSRDHYRELLNWYEGSIVADAGKYLQSAQAVVADPALDSAQVQAGILSGFSGAGRRVTHGALLLMTITDAARAREFIGKMLSDNALSFEGAGPDTKGFYRTIAFTSRGFEAIGMFEVTVDSFAKEFREGMEKRSGLLGDYRENHPRNWVLPERNWPLIADGVQNKRPRVDMSEIDFVIQLRYGPASGADPLAADAVLLAEITRLADAAATEVGGAVLAAFEPMVSNYAAAASDGGHALTREHFGFVDGLSQPKAMAANAGDTPRRRDDVRLGEIVLGYRNDHEDEAPATQQGLQQNGSYLVIRKIAQDSTAFEEYLSRERARIADLHGFAFSTDDLAAALMGRGRDGAPLISPHSANLNDFDYRGDTTGDACPFASHIRRSNPRDVVHGRRAPRLMRRGMSFGDKSGEHGLVFMAYGASIAEQYEVIQRWINGGNSSGVSSAQNDPLLGVSPAKGERVHRFIHQGQVVRSILPKAFTKLHWGLYLFAPSRKALAYICNAFTNNNYRAVDDPDEAKGQQTIERLENLPDDVRDSEWNRILEDFDTKDPAERSLSPDIMSAIRWHKGGSYRIDNPRGALKFTEKLGADAAPADSKRGVVIVGSQAHMTAVMQRHQDFSVVEQDRRLHKSVGAIYVAMDPESQVYKDESTETNTIMFEKDEEWGFDGAYHYAAEVLADAKSAAASLGLSELKIELHRDFITPTLGKLCTAWFGLPNDVEMVTGHWSWDASAERPARCPGDFIAASRDAFFPHQKPAVQHYAADHGPRVASAGRDFVARYTNDRTNMPGVLSNAMAAKITDDDVLARNIIGMMIGALPPLDGNLRSILYEWLSEKELWKVQAALHRASGNSRSRDFAAAYPTLYGPVSRAICKRPAPDLLYRIATRASILTASGKAGADDIDVEKGDLVIVSQVSAAQRSLTYASKPDGDPSLVFGGERKKAVQDPGAAQHACPAQKMMMGTMVGIMAALLDAGDIQALPSSLIVRISNWQ